MQFKKPILIYIPCHNCEKTIVGTLSGIPLELQDKIECLVIDNYSTDRTSELVHQEIKNGKHPFRISLIRTKEDIGYAGSQKLAYFLASKASDVRYVIMLHGDGQYSPSLLTQFISGMNENYAIINGYRDKKTYRRQEETPFGTYYIIKILNSVESFITGYAQKEWHSGFVMYKREFLAKIPLQGLSNTRHIDGEFLICAGVLGKSTSAVPIYKKYDNCEAFRGIPRIKYIVNVFRIILRFKCKYYHRMLRAGAASRIDFDFDVIT